MPTVAPRSSPTNGGTVPPATSSTRDEILRHLDQAQTQRFHWTATIISGMGFFTDAYDLFVIALVIPLLESLYPEAPGALSLDLSILAAAALFGAVVGQVFFGYLADRVGRKRIYGVELAVMSVGAIGSALAFPVFGLSTILVVAIWRFLMGVGVGGDYPMSATIMSEFSNVRHRGRFVASVFAMQGFGLLAGAFVMIVSLLAFPSGATLDIVWRVVLGAGAVPAIATVFFRRRMPETPRFTLAVKGDVHGAARDVQTLTGVSVDPAHAAVRAERQPIRAFLHKYRSVLLGTALSWFLLDMAFYASNIFNPKVLSIIGFVTSGLNLHAQILTLAEGQAVIALLALVPGYWAAVALIDRWGRRTLQLLGFGVAAAAFLVVAALYEPLLSYGLVAFLPLYASTFFFMNFGPNTTTFVLPSEVYPTQFRSTGHGLSAAAGKLGAAVATFLFLPLQIAYGLPFMLALLGAFCFLGLVVTAVLTPETAGRTLEEASREDEFLRAVARISGYFGDLTSAIGRGAAELQRLLDGPMDGQDARISSIRQIEHEADAAVHRIYVDLNNNRMDPAVRSDVAALAGKLDDIIDGIEAVSARVETYHLRETDDALRQFAGIVVDSVQWVRTGVASLDELLQGDARTLQAAVVEVNRLENEADDVLRGRLSLLFNGSGLDVLTVLKLKDFYERLEIITDRCEDVADVFKDLTVRYAPGAAS